MSRAAAAFARASNRLYAHYGVEAVFRGQPAPVVVVLSRNVRLIGEDGLVDRVVTTAMLSAALAPREGDSLVVGAEVWRLDQPLRGDGDDVEWVLAPVAGMP